MCVETAEKATTIGDKWARVGHMFVSPRLGYHQQRPTVGRWTDMCDAAEDVNRASFPSVHVLPWMREMREWFSAVSMESKDESLLRFPECRFWVTTECRLL